MSGEWLVEGMRKSKLEEEAEATTLNADIALGAFYRITRQYEERMRCLRRIHKWTAKTTEFGQCSMGWYVNKMFWKDRPATTDLFEKVLKTNTLAAKVLPLFGVDRTIFEFEAAGECPVHAIFTQILTRVPATPENKLILHEASKYDNSVLAFALVVSSVFTEQSIKEIEETA